MFLISKLIMSNNLEQVFEALCDWRQKMKESGGEQNCVYEIEHACFLIELLNEWSVSR